MSSTSDPKSQAAEEAAMSAANSAADAEITVRNVLLIVLPALSFAFLAGIAIWAYFRHYHRRPSNRNTPRGRGLGLGPSPQPMTTTTLAGPPTIVHITAPAPTRQYRQPPSRQNSTRITGLRATTTHRPTQGLNEFGEAPPPYNQQVKADEEVLLSQWAPGHPLPSPEMLQRQLDVQREYEQNPGLDLDLEQGNTAPLPSYEGGNNTTVTQIPTIMVECVDANSPTSPRPVHLP
ncbi:hypothetical protein BROUX41_004417 [Berkeleyomyces rouxiae]|uniref:uncharacterized protein n=1 Tax=Berkeleyomyces rouxiae TaxID=2035830 RepID=UPI003B7E25E2